MYGGNPESWDTKYICAGDYFRAGNLCEFGSHGHYTHGSCRLWSLRKNTGACDCRGEWDGKRADSHCGVQLWSKKAGKDISELPMGDAVFRYALQRIFSHYGNRAGTGTFVV